ncbi:MAG: penicillin-binding protein 2 [Candidatus Harrisonbacteria bacterium CG10_big_fil_rev_8_21_14_0_10_44_23]|uniref:Penicillin-binding protein 2 n=1 Tax=Candidatus Harrisonbacteria bacterium CG10_big_fil_rev_8_21_14_0_10_44_23 TaxID=1974585 RepID=A0A2H0UQF6_9BACT|nr:MAG: penicillin-binding protein 2 [Candidatus Harrisonbacteria bacterium CG10_big_fil_rev_8_21_14_0_10_44_23]
MNRFDINDIISDASAQSNDYIERPITERVFWLFSSLTVLTCLAVFSRLAFLNIAKADIYQERAQGNAHQEISIPALRGIITDRYGEPIAKNAETFSVFINLSKALQNPEVLNDDLARIAQTLEIDPGELRQTIYNSNLEKSTSLAIARNVDSEQAIKIRGLGIDDIAVINDYRREYPYPEAFAHVIGYTGPAEEGNEIVGKIGLEAVYDKELRGRDGASYIFRDAFGNEIDQKIARDPIAGDTIKTTLDAKLQNYFYERLKQGLKDLGVYAGVGLAIQPDTGEVLALISMPSFDSNVFVEPNRSDERVDVLLDSHQPLFNRAVSGAYNPASTIKPLVALAALKEKVVDDVFGIESKGYIEIPNPYYPDKPSRFLDWKAHGWVNVRSALARSSNVYFYAVGGGFEDLVGLGIDRLRNYWQYFGLGSTTGIDLNAEATGFLPSIKEKEDRTGQPWRVGDTYNISIGQGNLRVTPIQLIRFIASIGTRGLMYRPYVAKTITDSLGEVVLENNPEVVLSYSDWKFELGEVRAGMEQGVTKDYGTSHLLSYLPFSSAGKTGSAQIQNNTKTNAFFVGYAPAENPEIAILVLVEDSREGSLNTIPIAKDVLDFYYKERLQSGK